MKSRFSKILPRKFLPIGGQVSRNLLRRHVDDTYRYAAVRKLGPEKVKGVIKSAKGRVEWFYGFIMDGGKLGRLGGCFFS